MTKQNRRILFLAESVTLAHVVRPLMLAHQAREQGYEIYFATGEAFQDLIGSPPGNKIPLRTRSPEEFHQTLQSGECLFPFHLLQKHTEEELSLIRDIQPDLIISDLRPSASVSAKLSQTPHWVLTNAYWSAHLPDTSFPLPCMAPLQKLAPRGKKRASRINTLANIFRLALPLVLRKQKKGLQALRKHYGLAPLHDYRTLLADGDKVLYADIPELFSFNNLPTHHHFLGHIPWCPDTSLPSWSTMIGTKAPSVFISLGSSGSDVPINLVLEGLRSFEGDIVISSNDTSLHNPANGIYAAPFLPGDFFAKRALAVITNGGSPSTYQALSEQTPVIGITSNMDQMLNMQHVDRVGAGIMLRSDTFLPCDITTALESLLHSFTTKKQVHELSFSLEQHSYQTIFSELLDNHFYSHQLKKVSP